MIIYADEKTYLTKVKSTGHILINWRHMQTAGSSVNKPYLIIWRFWHFIINDR